MVQERLLWIDHHPPTINHHHALQTHHPHPKTDLVCPLSPENGFSKDRQSPESSDSEDLHYGPGIVNKLRNKYLSLALRESNTRPTILRKATSLENLLDEDEGEEEEKEDGRLFRRRGGGNDGGSHLNRYRSSNRRQEMKRARSVEAISRTNHDEEMSMTTSVTTKINNRQSLHEEILIVNNVEKEAAITDTTRPYKKSVSVETGVEDTNKFNGRINRPKRIPPLLNEREKPPVDVVKHAKLIFEKKPETRTKKPPQTGEVASKVNSFNSIIVKTKLSSMTSWKALKPVKPVPNGKPKCDVAAKVDSFNNIVKSKTSSKVTKPPIKTNKPVLNDKPKSNTQLVVRPVAKPVILSEEMTKPKSLDLKGPRMGKKEISSLPSPIPDVSRVDIKNQDGSDPRNNPINSLCETPDLILTSSPIPKITSPTYRKRTTENFLQEERNSSFLLGHKDAPNRYISPVHSPTKIYSKPPTSLNFNKEDLDSFGIKMISPISQKNITKNSASSVFNFINSQVDQNHLPAVNKNVSEQSVPVSEPLKIEVNGFSGGSKPKMGLSAFEIEKNQRNAAKSGLDSDKIVIKDGDGKTDKNSGEIIEKKSLKPVSASSSADIIGKNRIETTMDSEKLGHDVVGLHNDDNVTANSDKKWQLRGSSVEKTSSIFENFSKSGKITLDMRESLHKNDQSGGETSNNVEKIDNILAGPDKNEKLEEPSDLISKTLTEASKSSTKSVKSPDKIVKLQDNTSKIPVKSLKDVDKIEKIDQSLLKSQNKSASVIKHSIIPSISSEETTLKVAFPKKKPKVEETTTVFNFTGRKDVPDYIANDKSRTPSRVVLPKRDEPGIKLLPEALLSNFKEMQEVWEEEELIRSLEARPPSPCDITFINDNILIDGKSCFVQRAVKRVKLKISFVDDVDTYEYPSETSLLLEDSPLPSPLGGSAQVGHTVPTLTGSSLATYTPKTTETFQLGITKTFQEPMVTSKPDVTDVPKPPSDLILEEIEQPILFSSGGTSDILF